MRMGCGLSPVAFSLGRSYRELLGSQQQAGGRALGMYPARQRQPRQLLSHRAPPANSSRGQGNPAVFTFGVTPPAGWLLELETPSYGPAEGLLSRLVLAGERLTRRDVLAFAVVCRAGRVAAAAALGARSAATASRIGAERAAVCPPSWQAPAPDEDGEDCPICLSAVGSDDAGTRLQCGHCYHADCIDAWLRQHATCPVCRSDQSTSARPLPTALCPLPSAAALCSLPSASARRATAQRRGC